MITRALITGITGFVGSHLADFILKNHPEVELLGLRRWYDPMDNLAHIPEGKIRFVEGDLTDPFSMIEALFEAFPDAVLPDDYKETVVFHLAAQSYVPASYRMPVATLLANGLGTLNMLEALRSISFAGRIHICSSPEVYGQPKEEDLPWTERALLAPRSPYALSKCAEDLAAYTYFVAYGLKTIVTRAFAHEGPRRGNVFAVSTFAEQIARIEKGLQPPLVRVGNLQSSRTYCDVRDTVRAYWLAVEKCPPGEVYNIAGTRLMTIQEVLHRLIALSTAREKIEIDIDPKRIRPTDVTLQVADFSKFHKATGWAPEIPFEQTLKDTLDYWRQNV